MEGRTRINDKGIREPAPLREAVHLTEFDRIVVLDAVLLMEESLKKHRLLTVPGANAEGLIDKKLAAIDRIRDAMRS